MNWSGRTDQKASLIERHVCVLERLEDDLQSAGPRAMTRVGRIPVSRCIGRLDYTRSATLTFDQPRCYLNWNKSNKSPIAGMFFGTYSLLFCFGLGRLSRLRPVSVAPSIQFRSTNFTNDECSL